MPTALDRLRARKTSTPSTAGGGTALDRLRARQPAQEEPGLFRRSMDFLFKQREPLTRFKEAVTAEPDAPEPFRKLASTLSAPARMLGKALLPESVFDVATILPSARGVGLASKPVVSAGLRALDVGGSAALAAKGGTEAVEGFQEGDVGKTAFGAAQGLLGGLGLKGSAGRVRTPAPRVTKAATPATPSGKLVSRTKQPGGVTPNDIEQAAITTQRAKLEQKLGRPLTPEEATEIDLLGTEYRRTRQAAETGELGLPPNQETQALKELGGRLTKATRSLKSERGAINPALLADISGAAAGGAAGSTQGETPEERIRYGLLGAFLGSGALGQVTRSKMAGRTNVQAVGDTLKAGQRAGLLIGGAPIKAALGAAGGTTSAVAERMLMGKLSPGQLLRAIPSAARRAPAAIGRALKGEPPPGIVREDITSGGAFSLPYRLLGAVDAPARELLQEIGMSTDEASRVLLSGSPLTKSGQAVLDPRLSGVRAIFTPVGAQTGVNVLEQGLQRTPGLNLLTLGKSAGGLKQTPRELLARTVTGAGAGAAAYGIGRTALDPNDPDDARTLRYLVAAAGPAALPAAIGTAVAGLEDVDIEDPESLAKAADVVASGVMRESPAPLRTVTLSDIFERQVPRLLREEEFETGYGALEDLLGRSDRPTINRPPTRRLSGAAAYRRSLGER